VTGLVGAGGGFLIVPALVLFAGLEMKTAIGTSLAVIAVNSLVGFVGEAQASSNIQWSLILTITVIAIAGILVGGALGKMVSGAKLKPAFGWFILAMGVFLVGNSMLAGCKVVEQQSSGGFESVTDDDEQFEIGAVSEEWPSEISAFALNALIESGDKPFLLDVRTAEERDISVLDDDANIPIDELADRLDELDKDADIVVYCRTGNRSGKAMELLRENGFTKVRNLVGGINGWSDDIDPSVEKYGN